MVNSINLKKIANRLEVDNLMNKTYFDKIGGKNKNLDIKRQMFLS